MHRVFNAGNVLGTAAFLAIIAVPAACEGEMYITAAALTAVFAVCGHMAARELGRKNRPHHREKRGLSGS